MQQASMFLVLLFAFLRLDGSLSMPNGPPLLACDNGLTPNHPGSPRTDTPPINILYSVNGTTITVTLASTGTAMFKGYMMQVRDSDSGQPLGTFSTLDSKSKTLNCNQTADTVSHANPSPVTNVTVEWSAEMLPDNIKFYYTIVENTDTYWVLISSQVVQVTETTTEATTTQFLGVNGIPLIQQGNADILVRLHGSLMVFAWGLVAPLGLMIALFYKVVWPGGQWFYAHIGLMIATLVFSILGVVVIVVHSNGIWLTTTTINLPHQILGISALVAVAVNPFLAICRCYPDSRWRWIYNTIHGSIGVMLGQGAACGAMLLGLHIIRELDGVNMDYVHYAIYSVSATIGLIIMIPALFNIYAINYRKSNPTGQDIGVTSEPPADFPEYQPYDTDKDDDDDEEPSHDYGCRVCVGLFVIVILLSGAVANITMLTLI